MNIVIWIIQTVLALMFLAAGVMKMSQPKEKLASTMAWVNDFSPATVKLIGGLELLAGLGLVLPHLTGILPWLTPLAALGLVLTMLGAAVTHARRKEGQLIGVNIVLLALAAFVAIGRFWLVPV